MRPSAIATTALIVAAGCASSGSAPVPVPTSSVATAPYRLTTYSGASSAHFVEVDLEMRNLDARRALVVTAIALEPAAGLQLKTVRLVNASAPFNNVLTGPADLSKPVSLAPDTVKTIRLRFLAVGPCRAELKANPMVRMTVDAEDGQDSHFSSVPSFSSLPTTGGGSSERGWVLSGVRRCRG